MWKVGDPGLGATKHIPNEDPFHYYVGLNLTQDQPLWCHPEHSWKTHSMLMLMPSSYAGLLSTAGELLQAPSL